MGWNNTFDRSTLRTFHRAIFQPSTMEGPDIKNSKDAAKSVSIIFSLNEAVGALAESLKIFKKHQVNLLHIESRSSIKVPGYEFMVEVDSTVGEIEGALENIKQESSYFKIITRNYKVRRHSFLDRVHCLCAGQC